MRPVCRQALERARRPQQQRAGADREDDGIGRAPELLDDLERPGRGADEAPRVPQVRRIDDARRDRAGRGVGGGLARPFDRDDSRAVGRDLGQLAAAMRWRGRRCRTLIPARAAYAASAAPAFPDESSATCRTPDAASHADSVVAARSLNEPVGWAASSLTSVVAPAISTGTTGRRRLAERDRCDRTGATGRSARRPGPRAVRRPAAARRPGKLERLLARRGSARPASRRASCRRIRTPSAAARAALAVVIRGARPRSPWRPWARPRTPSRACSRRRPALPRRSSTMSPPFASRRSSSATAAAAAWGAASPCSTRSAAAFAQTSGMIRSPWPVVETAAERLSANRPGADERRVADPPPRLLRRAAGRRRGREVAGRVERRPRPRCRRTSAPPSSASPGRRPRLPTARARAGGPSRRGRTCRIPSARRSGGRHRPTITACGLSSTRRATVTALRIADPARDRRRSRASRPSIIPASSETLPSSSRNEPRPASNVPSSSSTRTAASTASSADPPREQRVAPHLERRAGSPGGAPRVPRAGC